MTDTNSKQAEILLVDDKPENLKVLIELLQEENYKILIATSGERALSQLARRKVDLILLDILMPDMNGFETCKQIKNNFELKDIPVIFITALLDSESKMKAFSVGAVDYISKPFLQEEVVARIKAHLTICEQKRILQLQNLKLKENNQTKDKFFSIIAHDLKSPFGSILSFSNLLCKNFDSYTHEKQKRLLNTMNKGIENSYKLLDNLLLWAGSQSDRVNYLPQKMDFKALLEETIVHFQIQLEKKNSLISHTVFEKIEVCVDKEMLATVLRNLISNAIKFTPKEGEIKISISQNNEDFIAVAVRDTGVGIPKEAQAKLFDISETTSTPGTENESGTGLGLILCKEFIEKHGGKIWVESEEGKGSEFIFTIPQKRN